MYKKSDTCLKGKKNTKRCLGSIETLDLQKSFSGGSAWPTAFTQLMEDAGFPEDLGVQSKAVLVAWVRLGSVLCKEPMSRAVCIHCCWCPPLSCSSGILGEVPKPSTWPQQRKVSKCGEKPLNLCCPSWAPWQLGMAQGMLWRRPGGTWALGAGGIRGCLSLLLGLFSSFDCGLMNNTWVIIS